MQKTDGSKALADKENSEIFCAHFNRSFNNQHPLPCDLSLLDCIKPHPTFSHLAKPPTPG
eukprot:12083275-Ditylum_brightwellii.AAC.1